MLYDHNQPKTFHSAAWDTYTNSDLTFFSHDANSSLPHPVHSVLGNFPKSQHRPTIIYHPALTEHTPKSALPRWNFNKADWERFHATARNMCDDLRSPKSDINSCYAAFQIPRGFRKNCIPKWDEKWNELASQHEKTQSVEEKLLLANRLIDHLNTKRKEQLISTVERIDMKRSSLRAWSTIHKVTGRKNVSANPNSISPNAVSLCPLNNGKFKNPNRQFTREANRQLKEEWNSPSADHNLSKQSTDDEIIAAIKSLKAGKAPRADNVHPEFFLHIHEN